jgi:hypothetical protein
LRFPRASCFGQLVGDDFADAASKTPAPNSH